MNHIPNQIDTKKKKYFHVRCSIGNKRLLFPKHIQIQPYSVLYNIVIFIDVDQLVICQHYIYITVEFHRNHYFNCDCIIDKIYIILSIIQSQLNSLFSCKTLYCILKEND
jgi:hypothetical protein